MHETREEGRRRRRARRKRERREVRKLRLTVVYWAWFVLLLLATLAVSLVVVRLLFSLHILIAPGSVLLLAVFAIITVLVGAVFSQVIVRGFTRPLLEMSDAAQKIAGGEYNISLEEPTFAEEIEDMAADFTDMAERLQATEEMRNDFIANVSHEMKTPLAVINGYAALLADGSGDEEERRGYAVKISENAKRLSHLTDDILLLSHLEEGGGNSDVTVADDIDLTEQLRGAILCYADAFGSDSDGRDLVVELDEAHVTGNADLLMCVWTNLIGNAVKFTSGGDTVTVRLEAGDARETERSGGTGGAEGARGTEAGGGSGTVTVTVADTGIGMTAEECERAFEKFFQADRSHATTGNGLGLALAKRIVDIHGGAIWADSEPGSGTEMHVTLGR